MSQVEALPKEVEPISPEASDSIKLEISPEVEENLTDRAKETAATLNPESQKFLGKLFEKIKSSEIVQNVVDRHEVSKNDKLGQRADNKIDGLNREKDMEIKGANDIEAAQKKLENDLGKVKKTLQSMNKELGQDDEAKVLAEIETHKKLIDEREGNAQMIEFKITDTREELEGYKNKAETARGRLDGRLAVKMEANNNAIQELNEKHNGVDKDIEGNQAQGQEVDENIAKLNNLLKEGLSGLLLQTVESNLKEFQSKKPSL